MLVISWSGLLEDGAAVQWALPPTALDPFEKYSLQMTANGDGATVSWSPCHGVSKQTQSYSGECSPYQPIKLTIKNPGRGFGDSVGVSINVWQGPAF